MQLGAIGALTPSWVVPFAVSAAVCLVATPAARRLALDAGLVDRPVGYKAHRRATPYLGGVAIAVAVVAGRLTKSGTGLGAVVTGLAAVLAIVGLVDDDRQLGAFSRLGIECGCAVAAIAAGLRITGTGVTYLDVALSLLLLVAVTNATNLMDNLDGLAAGVTAAGAAGAGVLGALGGQTAATIDAASLVGACLAFLAFNCRPAVIFMGDAGSLFLGFLLAAVAIGAGASVPEPASLVVPLLILALPITDTVVVTLGRLRHGRSPYTGGRDHLSHRLAGTGIGPGRAVGVLVGIECLLSALAVLGGRTVIPLAAALAGGLAVLLALVAVAIRVRVYREEAVGLPRALIWGGPLMLVAVGGMAAPAVIGMLRARGPALAGELAAQEALTAARSGQLPQAVIDLRRARDHFGVAAHDVQGPLVSAGLLLPVLSTNLTAARAIVETGLSLARLGDQLTMATDGLQLQVRHGALVMQSLARAAPGLRVAASSVDAASDRVAHLPHAYLQRPVAYALSQLQQALAPAQRDLTAAAGLATYLPPMMGADGPRRYFVAVQNPTESRGTGGLIGNWGAVVADRGRLQLQQFGRLNQLNSGGGQTRTLRAPPDYLARYQRFDPAGHWQNVNMSPDFPTVGAVIANLYPQSGGVPVDGVIGIDPAGLRALLSLTGPVQVAAWPVPIGADNVVAVSLHDAYVRFSDESQRADFLGSVAHAAFAAFGQLNLSDTARLVGALGPIVHQGDVQFFSTRPAEEAYLRQAGAAGALPAVRSDSLALTTQNVAGNKVDYYLHRRLDYQVTLRPQVAPDGILRTAEADVNLSIGLTNTAPAAGLPPSIIGPYLPQFKPAEESTFVSVYTSLTFRSGALNGLPIALSSGSELHRQVYSAYVDLASARTATLRLAVGGGVTLLPGGWYELDLPHQPLTNPDQTNVDVTLAPGWKVTGVRGGTETSPDHVRVAFSQDTERSVWVQIAAAGSV